MIPCQHKVLVGIFGKKNGKMVRLDNMNEECKHDLFYVNDRENTLGITYLWQCKKCKVQILSHTLKDWLGLLRSP